MFVRASIFCPMPHHYFYFVNKLTAAKPPNFRDIPEDDELATPSLMADLVCKVEDPSYLPISSTLLFRAFPYSNVGLDFSSKLSSSSDDSLQLAFFRLCSTCELVMEWSEI